MRLSFGIETYIKNMHKSFRNPESMHNLAAQVKHVSSKERKRSDCNITPFLLSKLPDSTFFLEWSGTRVKTRSS